MSIRRRRFPAAVTAAAFLALAASAGAAAASETATPMQAIVRAVGDKQVVAVYTAEAGRCALTAMVDETPEIREAAGLPFTTAARVRVTLGSGETATFDGGRGESLALTCGEGAAVMAVDARRGRRWVASRCGR